MMMYAEYQLTDLGFMSLSNGMPDPLPEIYGLSNQVVVLDDGEESDERFRHRGVIGYPFSHSWMIEKNGKVLALFDGLPDEGGTEIADADVLAKLVADYGFPSETTLDENGLPVVPEAAGVFA